MLAGGNCPGVGGCASVMARGDWVGGGGCVGRGVGRVVGRGVVRATVLGGGGVGFGLGLGATGFDGTTRVGAGGIGLGGA